MNPDRVRVAQGREQQARARRRRCVRAVQQPRGGARRWTRRTRPPPHDHDINRQQVTTTNNWIRKGRYDRFFTANNSGYASGQAAGDKIAGKTFFGGGQAGYSRQLLKNAVHLLVAEAGYDFSYERYVSQPDKTPDPVSVHSARLFVGDTLKLSTATGVTASVEALLQPQQRRQGDQREHGQPGVDPFKDTRVVGKAGITTTLVKSLSIGSRSR